MLPVVMLGEAVEVQRASSDQRRFVLLFLQARAHVRLEGAVEGQMSSICMDHTRRRQAGWLAVAL